MSTERKLWCIACDRCNGQFSYNHEAIGWVVYCECEESSAGIGATRREALENREEMHATEMKE